jgi:DNA-binding response OmpR family regulator
LRLLKKESCDLVMLDLELPEVDGLALCRLVRAQPALRQLPVLVFSANDSEQTKVDAFSAGADDYIVKPSTPGELISRVNSHLNGAQRESDLLGSNRELRFLADLGRGCDAGGCERGVVRVCSEEQREGFRGLRFRSGRKRRWR